MDMPSYWLQESGTQEQGFLNHYQMNKSYYCPMNDLRVDSFSSDSYIETPSLMYQSFQTHKCLEEPANIKQPLNKKLLLPTEKPKPKLVSDAPNSFTISFGYIKPKDEFLSYSDSSGFTAAGKKRVPTTVKNPAQVQDHVLAERKRREKLAQRFISLSSLLPDQKKMDKATVLEDASKHIKHLQNRVKELEETLISEKNIIHESTTSVSKSKSHGGHELEESSFDETNTFPCNAASNHGIKVRKLGSNVLRSKFASCIESPQPIGETSLNCHV